MDIKSSRGGVCHRFKYTIFCTLFCISHLLNGKSKREMANYKHFPTNLFYKGKKIHVFQAVLGAKKCVQWNFDLQQKAGRKAQGITNS